MPPTKRAPKSKTAESYLHPEADSPMRPEIGTQAQFKKKKPPQTYRYDSSLSPSLEPEPKSGIIRVTGPFAFEATIPTPVEFETDSSLSPREERAGRESERGANQKKEPPLPGPLLPSGREGEMQFQVELLGLDVFDPISMEVGHQSGNDVPAWLLDTDYNGLCFHVSQAFFPRTGAWENLKQALKSGYEESVWDHLAGTISAPFAAGEHGQIAVKVIDQRGNELLVVKSLKEAGK